MEFKALKFILKSYHFSTDYCFINLVFDRYVVLRNCSCRMFNVVITLVCLAVSVHGGPLAENQATIPRTEVLEIVISHSDTQTNSTEHLVKFNGTNICMTKGCVKASALVLDLIDENVDPCENFYEFACGKFLRNTFIPDDKIAMMSFVHVQDKVLGQLRLILNEKSTTNESTPFTLAKTFNTACMDQVALEEQGEA